MPETRHRTTIEVDVDDRAVRQLGQELERAIDPSHMAAFERSVERSMRAIERLTRATEKMARASSALTQQASGGGGGGGGGRGPGFVNRTMSTAMGTALGRGFGGAGARAVQMAGSPAGGEGFLGGMFGAIPYAGPVLSAAISGAQNYYGQYIGAQQARYGAFGTTGVGAGGRSSSDLRSLGYGPSSVPGVLQGMSGRSGRSGAELEQIAGQGAMYQRMLGVDPSSILGGAETQGAVSNPNEMMAQAIASAMVIGFRRTNWTEAVDGLSQLVGSLQTQGIQVSADSMMGLYRGLGIASQGIGGPSAPGLTGRAGAAFAQNIIQRGQGIGQGSSSFDFMMLQAAGGGRGGTRSLMDAQIFGERHGGEVFFNLLERLQGMSSGSQSDREQLGHYLQDNMGISADLAMQLASMPPEQVEAMRAAAENANVGQAGLTSFLNEQAGLIGGPAGAAEREAGLEAQRVSVGAAVAPAVQEIQDAEIALVTVFMPAALSLVTRVMGAAQELVAAFRAGGVAAVLARVAEMMTTVIAGVTEAVSSGAALALGVAADYAASQYGEGDPITQSLRQMQNTIGGTDPAGSNSPGIQPTAPGSTGGATGPVSSSGGMSGGTDPLSGASAALRLAANNIDSYRRTVGSVTDASLETV